MDAFRSPDSARMQTNNTRSIITAIILGQLLDQEGKAVYTDDESFRARWTGVVKTAAKFAELIEEHD